MERYPVYKFLRQKQKTNWLERTVNIHAGVMGNIQKEKKEQTYWNSNWLINAYSIESLRDILGNKSQ